MPLDSLKTIKEDLEGAVVEAGQGDGETET